MLRAVDSWHAAQERRQSALVMNSQLLPKMQKNLFFFPTKKSKVETITTIYSGSFPAPWKAKIPQQPDY